MIGPGREARAFLLPGGRRSRADCAQRRYIDDVLTKLGAVGTFLEEVDRGQGG